MLKYKEQRGNDVAFLPLIPECFGEPVWGQQSQETPKLLRVFTSGLFFTFIKEIFSISLIISFLALGQVDSDLKHFLSQRPIICLDTCLLPKLAGQGQGRGSTARRFSWMTVPYGQRAESRGDREGVGSWEWVDDT